MDITVQNSDLLRELNLLEKVIGKKPTISVLSNVLIRAEMGGLSMAATDLEIGLISGCAADVMEAGAITLPAKKLLDLVRAQSDTKVTMKSDAKGAVKFNSGGFQSRLQSLPAADFVGIPNGDGLTQYAIPRAPLKDAVAQVRFAISDKDSRFYTKGAYVAFNEDSLLMAATDSARLALTTFKRTGPMREAVLVPSKCLDELSALLAEPGDGDVMFAQSDRHLFFDVDARLLISRQVDGKFPAYERIIPKNNTHKVTVSRLEFASVLKRLVLIHDIVALSLKAFTLDLSAASAEVGDGVERLVVEYDGPDLNFKFQGQFILDFLSAATGEKVTLSFQHADSPALFSDGEYINVIMGMRL